MLPANSAGQNAAKSPTVENAPPSPEPRTGRCSWFVRRPPSVVRYPIAADPGSSSERGNPVAVIPAGPKTRSAARSWKLSALTASAMSAQTT